jgi:hypothetical protein
MVKVTGFYRISGKMISDGHRELCHFFVPRETMLCRCPLRSDRKRQD